MISLKQTIDGAIFRDLIPVKDLPQDVLMQLGNTLNEEGPCNWKALYEILLSENIPFSNEESEKLTNTVSADSSIFLSILCQKTLSVGCLLESLRLLPCQCSWRVLNNYLFSASESTMGHQRFMSFDSAPVPRAVPVTTNHPSPMSLPSNFEYTSDTSVSIISEHPKENLCVKLDDHIMLRCQIKSSFQGKPKMQWYHMFTPLEGQTSHMLMIPSAKLSDEGFYRCRIMYTGSREEVSRWSYVSVGHHVPKDPMHFATDKVALLIANEHYCNHKQLPAAPCDLQVLTEILQELNFKTLSFVNLSYTEIHRALNWLCSLAKSGCYCVFYFGGHGYENDGKCFMVPVDAKSGYGDSDCINVHTELENIQRRCSPSLMLILLDICRKRNTNRAAPTFVDSKTSFGPNVVLAYATMQSQEAFEKRGEKHGVFVECLRRHLAKPKRVNFMLTDVQDDVQKSRVQVAEVRTTLAEERCLTDYIRPRSCRAKVHELWMDIHVMLGNNVLTTELGAKSSVARIHMEYRMILTNKMEIALYLSHIDDAKYKAFCLFIEPQAILSANQNCPKEQVSPTNNHHAENSSVLVERPFSSTISNANVSPIFQSYDVDLTPEILSRRPFVMRISNLQRLKERLIIPVEFLCESRTHENKWYRRRYAETLKLSLFGHWHNVRSGSDVFSELPNR